MRRLFERHLFPWAMDRIMARKKFSGIRRDLLGVASGDTLEIGFGTGLNLPHYPVDVRRLTAVDVNPGMNRRALRRIADSPMDVEHQVTSAQGLPMENESFDTAVSTWTLCSIPDPGEALREIRRVLRPQGRLLFVEHGLSNEPDVQRWQHRLNGIQRVLGAGCNLNRNFRELVLQHGFKLDELREFCIEGDPRTHGYTYRGIARPA